MKRTFILLLIVTAFALAQSESRTDPAPVQQPLTEATTGGTVEETQPATCMGGGGIMSFLPMIAIIAIFYFLMIRPQQKQAKILKIMREALKRDDRVVTSGGIHGIVTNVKGDILTIRIADGVKIDVDRNSLHAEGSEGESCSTSR